MTDRLNALIVVLEKDTREDDAEGLIDAIRRLRGVLDVRPNVAKADSKVAEIRAKNDIAQRLIRALDEPEKETR